MENPKSSTNNVAHSLVQAFYKVPEAGLLSQGDIISCDELRKNLISVLGVDPAKDVYPYFFANYAFGIVLNADCDIFLDEHRTPKVGCIQIASVVEGSEYIKAFLKRFSHDEHYATRVINEKAYRKVVKKFEQLINNQEKIYFYLPENPNIGFKSAHLVRLDTSVSIKLSDRHTGKGSELYKAILQARLPATLEEPYKSKLGENFAALFDRTGLTDVKDHLFDAYERWIRAEMEKYFISLEDPVYRRAKKEIRELATKLGAESKEYTEQLPDVLAKFKNEGENPFADLPAFESIKKIIQNRAGKNADAILQNIFGDPQVIRAFEILQEAESIGDELSEDE